jgi:hypothetical protein
MTDAKSAWNDAGDRLSGLGLKLKLHYEQQRGMDSAEAKAEMRDALHRLTAAMDGAFEAIGTAARDDAVKSDVKQVGQSLATALGATFTQVSGELQRAFGKGGPGDAGEPEPGAPAAGTPGAAAPEPAAAPEAAPEAAAPEAAGPEAAAPEPEAAAPEAGSGGAPDGENGGTPKVEPWGTP